MKVIIIISAIIFFFHPVVRGQNSILRTVVDNETGTPIAGVHVYNLDHLKTGTITNENGRFILKGIALEDLIEVSHISYMPFIGTLEKFTNDTIKLIKRSIELDEIVIHGESGQSIMMHTIDSLSVNHSVEPVMYEVFVRAFRYEKDFSELHVLSEYLMKVYQKENHDSEFRIVKTRAKAFSDAGKKYFKDMRMISAISIYTDNIFKYKYDIFNNKKIKYYNIEIGNDSVGFDNNYFQLICTPNSKKVDYNFVLFIDKSTYAVKKIINYYSDPIGSIYQDEIGFKKINNKWFLDYSHIKRPSSILISKWKANSKTIYERLVIYNICEECQYDKKSFKSVVDNIAEPIKWYIGEWSDEFWEDYNYIFLPDWIRAEIKNSNSR